MEDASAHFIIKKGGGRIEKPEGSSVCPRVGKDVRDRTINTSRTMEGKYQQIIGTLLY